MAHVLEDEVYFTSLVLEDGEQVHDVRELEFAEDRDLAHRRFDHLGRRELASEGGGRRGKLTS